jgi:hypothetical protein
VFSSDRSAQRKFLAKSWEKYKANQLLEPLELQLAKIIEKHPEYQEIINNLDTEYFPEQGKINPFLHINLHLSLQDQLSLDQPKGIKKIYNSLVKKIKDTHRVEHIMMEQIAEMIFNSQKNNKPMDQEQYLRSLKELI